MRDLLRLLVVGVWMSVCCLSLVLPIFFFAGSEWPATPLHLAGVILGIIFGSMIWLNFIFGGGLFLLLEIDDYLSRERPPNVPY